MSKFSTIFIVSVALLLIVFLAGQAYAQVQAPGTDLTVQKVYGILVGLACWVMRVAISVIVIMLVYYAILFFNSQGNPAKFTEAKKAFIWGLVGILVILGVNTIIVTVFYSLNPSASYANFFNQAFLFNCQPATTPEFQIPTSDQSQGGGFPVQQPGPVQPGSMLISSISPSTVSAGDTMSIFGSNFTTATVTVYNTSGRAVGTFYSGTLISSGQVTWILPPYSPGNYRLRLGEPGGTQSNAWTFIMQ